MPNSASAMNLLRMTLEGKPEEQIEKLLDQMTEDEEISILNELLEGPTSVLAVAARNSNFELYRFWEIHFRSKLGRPFCLSAIYGHLHEAMMSRWVNIKRDPDINPKHIFEQVGLNSKDTDIVKYQIDVLRTSKIWNSDMMILFFAPQDKVRPGLLATAALTGNTQLVSYFIQLFDSERRFRVLFEIEDYTGSNPPLAALGAYDGESPIDGKNDEFKDDWRWARNRAALLISSQYVTMGNPSNFFQEDKRGRSSLIAAAMDLKVVSHSLHAPII